VSPFAETTRTSGPELSDYLEPLKSGSCSASKVWSASSGVSGFGSASGGPAGGVASATVVRHLLLWGAKNEAGPSELKIKSIVPDKKEHDK
jgi:hypothetical protein